MSGIRIGRILGVDIHLHGSWLIIVGLVIWSLSSAALPADFPEIAAGPRFGMALGITLLFFLSLLAHELAHSVVAMARGIPVHRITFFLFGGMAQTSRESRSPGEEFLIAVAGPAASFLLAAVSIAVWWVGAGAGWSPIVVGSAAYIGVLNLVLGIFNMLPGFPMDGGRILRAIIWKITGSVTRATRWASRVGAGMAWLLIAYGFWEMVGGDVMGGVWLVFIGWFIRHAARTSYRQHLLGRMQELTQAAFASHYHRHPPGRSAGRSTGSYPTARPPVPGGSPAPARSAPEPGVDGRHVRGRDVTGLGGGSG